MTDVLVVGAGPAGLAAAQVLVAAGLAVTVAERQPQAGGMPLTCGHSPYGWREFRRVMGGPAYAARLIDAARGADLRLATSVAAIHGDGSVTLTSNAGTEILTPRKILLATGAREATRAERLLPGERPLGVMTTGSLQDMWFRHGTLPFRRPVILGSELVAMSAILTCRQAGAAPLALLEQKDTLTAAAPYRWLPNLLGLPVHRGVEITDLVAKDGRLDAIRFRSGGKDHKIFCDGLILTGAFRPEAGLARMAGLAIDRATMGPSVDGSGRTSREGVYAAGNILRGVETAGWCWAEGRAIAQAMLADQAAPGHSKAQNTAPQITLLAGQGLRWIMPQAWHPGAALTLQLNADRPHRGHLVARDSTGSVVYTRKLTTAPERRVTLSPQLGSATGPVTFSLEV